MLIPYHADVAMERVPVSNFALIGVTMLGYIFQYNLSEPALLSLVLTDAHPLTSSFDIMLHCVCAGGLVLRSRRKGARVIAHTGRNRGVYKVAHREYRYERPPACR